LHDLYPPPSRPNSLSSSGVAATAMPVRDAVALSIEIAKKYKQRQKDDSSLDASQLKIPVHLPVWPSAVRGIPNGVLRSALFGVIKKGERRYMQKERIAALEGIEIFYTGQRLDQGDLDTWISGLHFSRLQEMGQCCHFTAYSILKLMRKTDSGKNREILDTRLSRLNATAVRIKSGKYSYEGSLIDSVYRDEDTREYVVVFNPKMQALFASAQFTLIDLDVRQELDGKPLAQWLHCFYASHAKPFPYKATTLLTLSGSENSNPHSARQKLFKALDAITEASNRHAQPFSYEIQGDLVHVKKSPSRSQQRHLKKNIALNGSRRQYRSSR